jgi:glycosyltransferase involved in cell wall biosynthesis
MAAPSFHLMRILYLHQYFRTPEQGGALRSYYLATALVEAGYEVEMITAHNSPDYRRETVTGITVHYLPVAYDNAFGFFRRVKSFLQFAWQSTRLALSLKGIAICYATSTPITVGLTALILKKVKRIPFYFEVRDLWPEAPIQLGYIRNKMLIRLLHALERQLYRAAEKTIALSPGMAKGIALHQPAGAIHLLPNMADTAFFTPVPSRRWQAQDPFYICYTGAIARANRLDFLLDIARLCRDRHLAQVKFLIAGTGAEARRLAEKSGSLGLRNVSFLGYLNREQIRELLQTAHATYTSFDRHLILQTNSPNKFFDSLAAGKLTIVNTRGWLQELVEQHQCGFYADPCQPEAFIRKLQPYLTNANLLVEAQQHARQLAEQQFSRHLVTRRFLDLFPPAKEF